MDFKTLKELFQCSTETYKDNRFLCIKGGPSYTYRAFGKKVAEVSALLLDNKIISGEKVGILSQNMPNWGVAFMSCTAYGRVAVPMLPDFTESEITNIIRHSGCRGLFVSRKLYHKISEAVKEQLDFIVEMDSFSVLKGNVFGEDNAVNSKKEYLAKLHRLQTELQAPVFTPDPEDLAAIIYTSGTTGNSKGVMLSHRNLVANLYSARAMRPSFDWDVWLSILPLSHTLECTLCFLLPFSSGSSVHYLDKAPTPTVLMKALKEIRPTTFLVVPLIIEKIYRNAILPKVKSNAIMARMYKSAIGRRLINRLIGKEMKKMFGGRMRFLGIGGAKLDGEVERFLLETGFPYAIGYGLTECSPLLAGAPPHMVKWQTTGPAVPGVQLKISRPDPTTGEGEIVAKGDNIMQGYYKNPKATAEAFTADGWFRTRDRGFMDEKGWLSIRGRLNSMIVGPSGENIYPEEIEAVINSHSVVAESLVTSHKGMLVAKVCLSEEKREALARMKEEALETYRKKKLQIIESYETRKAEWLKEYELKKGTLAKAYGEKKVEWQCEYDEKRRELYKHYVARREEAAIAYQHMKDERRAHVESLKKEIARDIHDYVNSKVNKFSRIAHVELMNEAFEKTATHKIKRYLYTN